MDEPVEHLSRPAAAVHIVPEEDNRVATIQWHEDAAERRDGAYLAKSSPRCAWRADQRDWSLSSWPCRSPMHTILLLDIAAVCAGKCLLGYAGNQLGIV